VETGGYFLDAEEEIDLDPVTDLCDVLNLDSIYKSRTMVDCSKELTCESSDDEAGAQTHIAPSERALRVLVDGAVLDHVGMTALNILSLVIFDTGASLTISPHWSDFLDVKPLAKRTQLGGMGKGLEIEGIGDLVWTFDATDGSVVEIRTNAYYVPGAKARLLSPQKLFDNKRGVFGHFYGEEDKVSLKIGNCPEIEVRYCTTYVLPIAEARCGPDTKPTANLSVLDDENTNFKTGEKLLLEWHYPFGHLNFASVRHILCHVPFVARRFKDAVQRDIINCHVCQKCADHCT
jgi:hypothetical protein